MQKLDIYQSRWAMELRRLDIGERTDDEAFAMVAKAGFDGMCLDLADSDLDTIERTQPFFRQHGLGCMINAFPKPVESLMPILQADKAADAVAGAGHANLLRSIILFGRPGILVST